MTRTPDETAIRAADARARELAVSQFDRPVALVAGAGSGKTATLVARVVVWVMGPGFDAARGAHSPEADRAEAMGRWAMRTLDRVLAITFTEKATLEMSERITEVLAHIARGASPPPWIPIDKLPADVDERVARARALLDAVDHLHVETIHGFCHRLLADHALKAGLHPQFEVDAEGKQTEAILDEILADWVRRAFSDPVDESAVALAGRGLGPEEIREVMEVLLRGAVSPDELAEDKTPREDLMRRLRETSDLVDALLGFVRTLTPIKSLRTMPPLVEELQDLQELLAESSSPEKVLEALSAREWSRIETTLKTWRKGEFAKRIVAAHDERELQRVRVRARSLLTVLPHFRALDPEGLRALQRAIAPLYEELIHRRRRRGLLNFDELLHGAADLLRDHAHVTAALRGELDQLLVDEVQDTDPVQYDIIGRIALEGPAGERPGLLVVGDPKQSIYGFRGADLAAYEDFLARVRAEGGAVASLQVNFRSTPAILREVERLIGPTMVREAGLQPAFEVLIPAKEDNDDATDHDIEYWLSWKRSPGGKNYAKTTQADAIRIEADRLRGELLRLRREEGISWSDVAILTRTAAQQEPYLAALREAGIPYQVEDDKGWYRRREIVEATAFVSTIFDPRDQLSLITWLRSPVVGLPDAALLPLWSRGFPAAVARLAGPEPAPLAALDAMIEDVAASLPDDLHGAGPLPHWSGLVRESLRRLAHARAASTRLPATRFVPFLRDLFPLECVEAARPLGEHRVANLTRFFRLLREALAEGADSPLQLLARFRGSVQKKDEASEASPGDATRDAVRIMTIHKAKGLDFEIVVLPGLAKQGRGHTSEDAVLRHAPRGRAEWRLGGMPSLDFDVVSERQRRREGAERVRTLYVAVTRPKRKLILAGPWPKLDRTLAEPCDEPSFAHLVGHRRGGVPDPLPDSDPSEPRWFGSEDSVGFCLIHGVESSSAVASLERAESLEIGGDDVEKAWTARREARAAAESRRGRALLLRPSDAPDDGDEDVRILRATIPDTKRAMRLGTLVHKALEVWDFDAEPAKELERIVAMLGRDHPADSPLVGALRRFLGTMIEGRLFERLRRLGREDLLGREVPILMNGPGPTQVYAGTADLVYRDPDTAEVVVADFKTDHAPDEAAISLLTRHYAPQLRLYGEAIRLALDLETAPRLEFWFLSADRIACVGD